MDARRLRLGAVAAVGALAVTVLAVRVKADSPQGLDPKVTAPAEELSRAFEAVAEHVKPAVVSVFSEKMVSYSSGPGSPDDLLRHFFGSPGRPGAAPHEYKVPLRGMGSGMILDQDGHILTNYHVVKGFEEIKVQLASGAEVPATVRGYDARTDVAVLQVKNHLPSDTATITLGDSDRLKVGELVLAVGAPFGLPQTVTRGIISATGRAEVGIADFEDFLQTDTAINPGNSGGPLVNMRGEVVGINSAIATSVGQFSGVGFSIPVNMVKAMLPTLIKGGKITRGQLGVVIQDLDPELAEQFHVKPGGVLVAGTEPGSPAQKAGILRGDVITAYAGKPVENSGQFRNLVAATAPGKTVDLTLTRNGTEMKVSATLGKLTEAEETAEAEGDQDVPDTLGMDVQDLTPQAKAQLHLKGGVLVTDVQDGSPAAVAGIEPNDVILEVNRRPVRSVGAFRQYIEQASKRGSMLFLVQRGNGSFYAVVRTQ